MRGARHWDARLHRFVGGLPDTPADRWLRRLTTAADHGRVWMAVGAPILMRTGVQLAGMGELTEVRAVSLTSTVGYPSGVAAIVKQVAVEDHIMVVRDMWLNGNYAAGGGSCHGIAWSGPGGNATGYPGTNPDPSNHIRDVRLSAFTTGTRHAIWVMNNCRTSLGPNSDSSRLTRSRAGPGVARMA